jgi:4-amino-4-deoxy-L-arabinose transferase-like glycosyltransferase
LKADAKKVREDDYSQDATRVDPYLRALNEVTFFAGILMILVSGVAASRMIGRAAGLGVMLLMAFDPILIHMCQHAMIDGFFAFWALVCFWTTWENLRQPNHRGWLLAHVLALAAMVLTKENAFFVYVALGVAVLANRWLHFGKVTGKFVAASVGGGALGAGLLIALYGGLDNVLGVFRTFVIKAQTLEQVLLIGDGPWYRYLLDMFIVSPLVICLALGALFTLASTRKELGFAFVFVAVSYAIMCNLPHGMNLRFATIWDFPLRLAAVLMLMKLTERWPRYSVAGAAGLVLFVGACEFRQYNLLATSTNPRLMFYELDTKSLLRPLKVLREKADLAIEDFDARVEQHTRQKAPP